MIQTFGHVYDFTSVFCPLTPDSSDYNASGVYLGAGLDTRHLSHISRSVQDYPQITKTLNTFCLVSSTAKLKLI